MMQTQITVFDAARDMPSCRKIRVYAPRPTAMRLVGVVTQPVNALPVSRDVTLSVSRDSFFSAAQCVSAIVVSHVLAIVTVFVG